MLGLLITIIVGFIVGVIAKLIMPGKENMGFIMTTLLGIAGSIVATYAGQAVGWYQAGQGAGWIGSIVGDVCAALDLSQDPVPRRGGLGYSTAFSTPFNANPADRKAAGQAPVGRGFVHATI